MPFRRATRGASRRTHEVAVMIAAWRSTCRFDRRSSVSKAFSKDELAEALRAIVSTIRKCEQVEPKLKVGSSQHTLLVRRIRALQIASTLIRREMRKPRP